MVGIEGLTAAGAISGLDPDFAQDAPISVGFIGLHPHLFARHERRKVFS
jgi:hypothetical protein